MGYGIQQALTDYGLPPTKNTVLPEWARHTPLPWVCYMRTKSLLSLPHYAEEILTPEFGCGLEDFLKNTQIRPNRDHQRFGYRSHGTLKMTHMITSKFLKATLSKRIENKRHLQSNSTSPKR
jgi:starch synthase